MILANIIFPTITYIFHESPNYNPRINWDKNVTVDNMKKLGIFLFPLGRVLVYRRVLSQRSVSWLQLFTGTHLNFRVEIGQQLKNSDRGQDLYPRTKIRT